LIRAAFLPHVPETASVAGIGTMLKSAAMYGAGLAMPLDIVLLNDWFGVPLPSQIRLSSAAVAVAIPLALVAALGVIRLIVRRGVTGFDLRVAGFLIAAIWLALAPVIVFTDHASETYLYLPTAFTALLLAQVFMFVLDHRATPLLRRFCMLAFGSVVVLMSTATWVRNDHVRRCGDTAERILVQATSELRANPGGHVVVFAPAPNEPRIARYGLYGFRGLDTIGDGAIAPAAVTSALQLHEQNERLTARVVRPDELFASCSSVLPSATLCAWVHADGRLELAPMLANKPQKSQ
jgi:hypothetical protein